MHSSARAALISHFDLLGQRAGCKTKFYLFSLAPAVGHLEWDFLKVWEDFWELLQLAGLAGAFLAKVGLASVKSNFSRVCVIICFIPDERLRTPYRLSNYFWRE